jgi:putative peptidoglycan lipid II flippase
MLGSSITVSVLSLLVSIISFINQLVIAKIFGASGELDAYLVATSLPTLVSGVFAAVISYSMVPRLILYRNTKSNYASYTGLMTLAFGAVAISIFLVGYASAPVLVETLGRPLPVSLKNNAIMISKISWATTGITLIIGYLGAVHNAAKRFIVPVLSSIFPFVGMLVFGLFLGHSWRTPALAWGLFAGSVFAGAALLYRALSEMDFTGSHYGLWRNIAGYFSQTPLVMLAMLCFTAYQFIDAIWAPRIGPGNLSYLGYCQRILVALGTLLIAGPSVVLVPRFAEAYAEGRHKDFRDDMGRAVRTVLVFSAPLALIVSLLAIPIVELLFERGAFDSNATQGVASILPFMMTGMVAMLCVVILFRGLYVRSAFIPAAFLGVGGACIYYIMSLIFIDKFSLKGIGLAYNISWYTVMVFSLLLMWKNHVNELFSRANLVFMVQLAILLAVVYLMTHSLIYTIQPAREAGYAGFIIRISAITLISGAVYFVMAIFLFKMQDVNLIVTKGVLAMFSRLGIKGT